ncbi:serine protease easter-like [Glossina fuscipes]|uniref:Serine protease easter-like n=1 Tax=Glossina fuscipes TaxID=7396 RepID=A0A9C5Z986_9MUSC|nr:serine protease easter-like [Glossina fuscipes]
MASLKRSVIPAVLAQLLLQFDRPSAVSNSSLLSNTTHRHIRPIVSTRGNYEDNAAVVGVVGLLLKTIPVQTELSKLASKLRMKIAKRTDTRVGIMNKLVQGIQNKGNRKRYKCEGSLISASYVIIVSHCVSGRLSLLKWHLTDVRFGEWNSEENSDCKNGKNANTSCASSHINVAIEYAVPHSLYSLKAKNQLHDIVLIRLAEVIHFTDFIKPTCLPLNKEERIIDFKSLITEEAGWNLNFTKIKVPLQGVASLNYHRMYMKRNIR